MGRRHARRMRTRPAVAWSMLVAALAVLGASASPATEGAGSVSGRVVLAVEGAQLSDVGPLVVYLEAPDGRTFPPLPRAPRVHQKDATFSPGFLVVARGQRVEMPNDDAIYHNVFSYSRPNGFDLGLYPAGESRSVTFEHAGVVRTYCSIHESMSGTIFVAPTPWFDVVRLDAGGSGGRFEIRGVPPGSWRVRTWCERLPALARDVVVTPGRAAEIELAIGASTP